MPIINRIADFHADMTAWRRDIHAHPELAFDETRTADVVAKKLADWGIEVHRGLAKTGVVGTLRAGSGKRAIGLRADMDALPLPEKNHFEHVSKHPGKMHACGHDGHTTMLLGAARYLAETKNFDGTIHFIFQPAEEGEGGGRAMVEEGLFKTFPVESVYGMHNMPGIPVGKFAIRPGPMMASSDIFEIAITAKGGHAAFPHRAVDAIVVGAQIVTALQSIVARNVDPVETAVVSVTQFHAGDAWNVLPDDAVIRGGTRAFTTAMQDLMERRIREVAQGICAAYGVEMKYMYKRLYPPLVNHGAPAAFCAEVARAVVGRENVDDATPPLMGSEDFAFMLQAEKGAYIFVGNGAADQPGGCMVHNPHYDFNDDILPLGATYWVRLAETALARR